MKYFAMIVMMVLTLALMVGSVIYLSNRFAVFFPVISPKKWLWLMGTIMFVMMFGQVFSVTPNIVGRYISMFSSVGTAMLLYLLFSVMIIELIQLLFPILPATRGIIALSSMLVIVVLGIINSYQLKVEEVTIPVEGLTKEIKAVHITDIHLGNFRGENYLNKVVDKINELHADVVFNTGDQFDSKAHFGSNEVLQAYKRLKIPHYFVYGNHDVYVGVDEVIRRMQKAGVIVLENQLLRFGELQIIGLNNMPKDSKTFDVHATPNSENIESVMAKLPINQTIPTLVLHHRPEGEEYMDAKKVDLLLSGHTHAGQMFPITFIAGQMFKYNKGLYKYNDMNIYVSQGAGTIFAPLRLATKSVITLIKLVPKK